VDQSRLDGNAPWYCRQDEEKNSWTANADHGNLMVEAVVNAWVKRLSG
jgi:hypothetical protein